MLSRGVGEGWYEGRGMPKRRVNGAGRRRRRRWWWCGGGVVGAGEQAPVLGGNVA